MKNVKSHNADINLEIVNVIFQRLLAQVNFYQMIFVIMNVIQVIVDEIIINVIVVLEKLFALTE